MHPLNSYKLKVMDHENTISGGYIMEDEKDNLIHSLESELARLQEENKRLEDTVQWMHDLIWQMVRERETGKSGDAAEEPDESSEEAEDVAGKPDQKTEI